MQALSRQPMRGFNTRRHIRSTNGIEMHAKMAENGEGHGCSDLDCELERATRTRVAHQISERAHIGGVLLPLLYATMSARDAHLIQALVRSAANDCERLCSCAPAWASR